ncbi:MAG: fibronectin type III domain-containing protein [Candidatus Methylomirabilia bacterium]
MRRYLPLALIGLAAAGCGIKEPPVAPERRVPAAVSGLSATVEGAAVVLTWTNPSRRADGSRLPDLTTLRVYRREQPRQGKPKPAVLSRGKVVGYDEVAAIRLSAPAPAEVEGSRVRWSDRTTLTVGRRYVYTVRAVDKIGRSSHPSDRVAIIFLAAPEPPESLAVIPGEREARLSWKPPRTLVDGTAVAGRLVYQVLRTPIAWAAPTPITPDPIETTSFRDRGLQNGQTYYYGVRAIRIEPAGEARSELSEVVAATPVDLTPPAAPTNLVAIPSAKAVRLLWNRSPEADVAGYFVYRAGRPGGAYARLNPRPIQTTRFVDRSVEPGESYAYVVTAVDRAKRANESARSNEATVSVP